MFVITVTAFPILQYSGRTDNDNEMEIEKRQHMTGCEQVSVIRAIYSACFVHWDLPLL